jgi:hypothetical protein
MPDKTIKCADCGQDFVFTEQEQEHYRRLVDEGKFKEYNEPKRCQPCRVARKKSVQRGPRR